MNTPMPDNFPFVSYHVGSGTDGFAVMVNVHAANSLIPSRTGVKADGLCWADAHAMATDLNAGRYWLN